MAALGESLRNRKRRSEKSHRQAAEIQYSCYVALTFANIVDEALRLPQDEQLRLVRTLLEKNEASGDLGVEAEWEEEIEHRIHLIDSGLAKGRPFADVLRDVDRRLGR
jgi:hypothetical protein